MKCLTPLSIPRPNGGGNADRITVPCGKCVHCLSNRRSQWSTRLEFELEDCDMARFVTLTYSDEHLYYNENGFPSVNKRDVQLFLKRFRRSASFKIRYFCTAEYGTKTYRPHYHFIFFFTIDTPYNPFDIYKLIEQVWEKGNVDFGKVTPASIAYCTKYVITNQLTILGVDPPFSLMSRRPGLGYNYIVKMKSWHNSDVDNPRFYIQRPNGIKLSMPRYFKDRIYSKDFLERHSVSKNPYDDFEAERNAFDPDGNYFKYQMDRFDSYVNNYTKKLTKTNKL